MTGFKEAMQTAVYGKQDEDGSPITVVLYVENISLSGKKKNLKCFIIAVKLFIFNERPWRS